MTVFSSARGRNSSLSVGIFSFRWDITIRKSRFVRWSRWRGVPRKSIAAEMPEKRTNGTCSPSENGLIGSDDFGRRFRMAYRLPSAPIGSPFKNSIRQHWTVVGAPSHGCGGCGAVWRRNLRPPIHPCVRALPVILATVVVRRGASRVVVFAHKKQRNEPHRECHEGSHGHRYIHDSPLVCNGNRVHL